MLEQTLYICRVQSTNHLVGRFQNARLSNANGIHARGASCLQPRFRILKDYAIGGAHPQILGPNKKASGSGLAFDVRFP
jgi:hypothetical protein